MRKQNASEDWHVVAAGFLCLTVAAGIGWYVFPVYLTTIRAELGWSMTQLTFAITVWALAGAAFSPIVGAWIDKYGPRRVMMIGTICQIVATVLIARMTALWHMYLLFILSSFASVANTHIPVSTAISQRFDKKRGAAIGIALLGMGFGGIVIPLLANAFLERYDWRTGYFIFAFFLLALLVPIGLWIPGKREKSGVAPGDEEQAQAGASAESLPGERTLDLGGLGVAEAVRTRSFWTLSFGDFLMGIVFTSVVVNMVAFTTYSGISQRSATVAYSAFLALNTFGILLFGTAADKIKIKWMMLLCYGAPAIAMVFLFRLPSLWFLYLFVIIFGMTGGGRSALWPLALGECFGVAHLGTIFGWLNIPFMMGNAIGPVLGGYIVDATGGYGRLFALCMGFSAVSVLFISRMRKEYNSS